MFKIGNSGGSGKSASNHKQFQKYASMNSTPYSKAQSLSKKNHYANEQNIFSSQMQSNLQAQ